MMDLFLTNVQVFFFYEMLIDSCWLPVEHYDIFKSAFGLSFWRHPFTEEDPLVSKLSNATFLQMCFDE